MAINDDAKEYGKKFLGFVPPGAGFNLDANPNGRTQSGEITTPISALVVFLVWEHITYFYLFVRHFNLP